MIKMKVFNVAICCVMLLVVGFSGCSFGSTTEESQKVEYLYVQTATSGTVSYSENDKVCSITLHGISPTTVRFANSPSRQAGTLSTESFVRVWDEIFKDNTPNVTLCFEDLSSQGQNTVVLVISDPEYDKATQTLIYKSEEITDSSPLLAIDGKGLPLQSIPESFGNTSVFIDSGGLELEPSDYFMDNMFSTKKGFQRGYYVVKALYDYTDKQACGALGWLYSKYPANSNKDISLAMWRELDWEYVPCTDTTAPFNTERYASDNVCYYYLPKDFNQDSPPPTLEPKPFWNTGNIVEYNSDEMDGYPKTEDGFYQWCNVYWPPKAPQGPSVSPVSWRQLPSQEPDPLPAGYPEVIGLTNAQKRSGHFITYGSHSIPASGTEGQNGYYKISTDKKNAALDVTNTVEQYVWMPDLSNPNPLNQRDENWNVGCPGFNVALLHFFYDTTGAFEATDWNYYVMSILDDGIKFYILDQWSGPGSLAGVTPIGEISKDSPCNAQALFDTPFAQETWHIMGQEQSTSAMEFMFEMWVQATDDPNQGSWSGHNPDFASAEGYVSYIAHYDQSGTQDFEINTNNWDADNWPNEFSKDLFVNTYAPYNVSFAEKSGEKALCLRIYQKSDNLTYINQLKPDGIVFTGFAVTPDGQQDQYEALDHLRFELYNPGSETPAYSFYKYPFDQVDQGIMPFKEGTRLRIYLTEPNETKETYLGEITFVWGEQPPGDNNVGGIVSDDKTNTLGVVWSDGLLSTQINIMLQNLPEDPSQVINTATGTGSTSFTCNSGHIVDLEAIHPDTLPANGTPPGADFVHGLFSFKIVDIVPGATVKVTKYYPSPLPPTLEYWKFHNGAWIECTSLSDHDDGDNVLVLVLTDGGPFDADGEANGIIVDPGGPAWEQATTVTAEPLVPRASPPMAIPPRPLNPAQMSVQYVSVNPQQSHANQPVLITTNVVNTGDEAGNLNVTLKINGQVEQTRTVSVGPQGTQPVKFTTTKAQPGTYTVDIGGQKGSFTVLSSGGAAHAPVNGGLIAVLILGVLVLATAMVLVATFRRPA